MVLIAKIILIAAFAFTFTGSIFAQSDTSVKPVSAFSSFFAVSESAKDRTKLERVGYVIGASLAFSLFDHSVYNIVRDDHKAVAYYRILETAVGSALTYFLYKECGINSAISFDIIWWTFGDDLGYYGWANLFKSRDAVRLESVTWAGWTPIGLTRKKNSVIDNAALTIQAMVGFSISIAIL